MKFYNQGHKTFETDFRSRAFIVGSVAQAKVKLTHIVGPT